MYTRYIWRFKNSIEYEYKFKGNYGAKGEKRAEKEKATPEQIKKQNQRNRENCLRRTMKLNFGENDYWITLKYPAGTVLDINTVKKHIRKFLDKTRRDYKKRGQPLKYVKRVEIGKRGSPHIHILVNRIPDADLIIRKNWEHGRVDFTLTYEAGGFKNLAEYITKPVNEEADPEGETKAYSTSKNLVRPQPEKKTYFRRTVEKIIKDGPEPTKGFYIVPDSVVHGVNKFTGMSYLYYEEVRIKKRE